MSNVRAIEPQQAEDGYAALPDDIWSNKDDADWMLAHFTHVMGTLCGLRGATPARILEDRVRSRAPHGSLWSQEDGNLLNTMFFHLCLGRSCSARLESHFPIFKRHFAEQHVSWMEDPLLSDDARLWLVSQDLDAFQSMVELDRS